MPLPALIAAAAPNVLTAITSALMTYGLSALGGDGSAMSNAPVSGSEIKSELEALIKQGVSEEEAARSIVGKYGPRMQAQGGQYKRFFTNPKYGLGGSKSKQIGSALKGGLAGGAKYLGHTALGLLAFDALANMLHGGGGELEAPQVGSGSDEIMAMLAQSGQGSRPTVSALREDLDTMRTMVSGQERMNALGYTPSGRGVRSDLDALIAGKEAELANMAHREPVSIAQALAARGLWRPRNTSGMRDLL